MNYKKIVALLVLSLATSLVAISCDKDSGDKSVSKQEIITKKGLCISTTTWDNPDAKYWYQRVRSVNASWYYTWKPYWTSGHYFLDKEEFVPMLWGKVQANFSSSKGKEAERSILWQIENDKISYLLGFNEPNNDNNADMTPEEAIELWPNLMKFNIPLGSPAPGSISEGSNGAEWLDRFLDLATQKNYRVDFICIHLYLGDAEKFKRIVTETWEKYQLPIWITEFAHSDTGATEENPSRFTEDDTLAFLEEVLPWLDSQPFVHRYAWFGSLYDKHVKLLSSQLFDPYTGELTKVGRFYSNYKSVPIPE